MRIAVLIGTSSKQAGGSHSYSSLLLEGILESNLFRESELVFIAGHKVVDPQVLFSSKNDDNPAKEFGSLPKFNSRQTNPIISFAQQSKYVLQLARTFRAKRLNRILNIQKIEFVWSLYPLSFPLNVPYAIPVWDLQHRLQPFWPEVSKNHQWNLRESAFRKSIQQATLIIVGTEVGAKEVAKFYGIPDANILVAPFPMRKKVGPDIKRDPNLIFYPAQFWPHKNHVNLILGFQEVLSTVNLNLKLLLPGSDKGNLRFVRNLVKELDIEGSVIFPGFISDVELANLYKSASLMIFPSYFGPDNLPPLEALSNACPVAVADVSGAREQFGESVLYFNPDSPKQIAEVINKTTGSSALGIPSLSDAKVQSIQRSPEEIVSIIGHELLNFQSKRRNWE
jgi:glycosyltransferase involved in cell wall biosynthesis